MGFAGNKLNKHVMSINLVNGNLRHFKKSKIVEIINFFHHIIFYF